MNPAEHLGKGQIGVKLFPEQQWVDTLSMLITCKYKSK